MENLTLYEVFYEVAKTKSISKATSTLFISQPAISKSIKKLETSLGVSLFYRSSKGVFLTPEGELLFEQVDKAFCALKLGEEKLQPNFHSGFLRIGVSTTLCKYLLLPYLSQFIAKYPQVTIRIHCQSSHETLKLLEEDQIDIGLVGKINEKKNYCYQPLEEIQDVFVATQQYIHQLHPQEKNTREILQSSTLMLLDKNNMTRQYIDDYLAKHNIHPKNDIEISNMDLLIEFAKIGMGVACVIKNFISEELNSGELLQIPLDIPIHKREVGFVYKKNHRTNTALQDFLQFCQKKEELSHHL